MYQKQNSIFFDVILVALVGIMGITIFAGVRVIAALRPLADQQQVIRILPIASQSTQSVPDPKVQYSQSIARTYDELDSLVADFIASEPNDYGLVIRHLDSGLSIVNGEKNIVKSASMYKLFTVWAALEMVNTQALTLNSPLEDTDGRDVKQCIWDSITVSDNPCGVALLLRTGLGSVQGLQTLHNKGFVHTDLRGLYPVTTAHDVALFYQLLYNGSLLTNPEHTELLKEALLAQTVNDRLPRGLPAGVQIAHKTGDLEGVAHDGGIVYSEQTGDYIVVILSDADPSGRSLNARYDQISSLMRQVHEAMAVHLAGVVGS